MQQISNKTLTFLLIAAIVVSIGGTIASITRINRLAPDITGMGTTGSGQVNVTITEQASLTIIDSQIDFGSCTPTSGGGCNVTSNSTSADCSCTGGTWPDNITVQNDGNANINVTVKTNVLASTLIGGDAPQFWFSTRNASTRAGCFPSLIGADLQWEWLNFSAADTEFTACGNLTYGATADQIELFAKLFLPADATVATGRNATLTFTANGVS